MIHLVNIFTTAKNLTQYEQDLADNLNKSITMSWLQTALDEEMSTHNFVAFSEFTN